MTTKKHVAKKNESLFKKIMNWIGDNGKIFAAIVSLITLGGIVAGYLINKGSQKATNEIDNKNMHNQISVDSNAILIIDNNSTILQNEINNMKDSFGDRLTNVERFMQWHSKNNK